ncbi:hypothetical protein [Mycolicibacterium sp. 018/SC-01/001]|uniref:hypothetical protein n=1 Tax=Mycolicibacterium sp. 018/SC-01/001 TaxID=2592069 RepID=UPI0021059093|nr:hypothetical protein [Mycolicibacterium sp. 018/SC-01/001]
MADCLGLWRRVLLVDAAGVADTSTDVTWLQGPTGYVDSRGFAGALSQSGDVFCWRRDVDIQPTGMPDAGRMRWENGTLVEIGVHETYEERWVREDGPVEPAGALFLSAGAHRTAVLVRVGELVAWASDAGVRIGDTADMCAWLSDDDHLVADGVRWTVTEREGAIRP